MNIVDNFLEKINNLPMLPKVVQEVMQLVNQEDVDFKQISSVINRDLMLTARVLRMSNSAQFGCSRSIKTIEEAIGLIGLKNLKTLVVASGVTSTFSDVPGMNLKQFWQDSLVTASLARHIAQTQRLDVEVAYIGGLMHAVGQIPLYMVFPAAAAQVEVLCRDKSVLERNEVETSVLGINHSQVGETLAKYWNFPEQIGKVISSYNLPDHDAFSDEAAAVNAAAHIAYHLEQADVENPKEIENIADKINIDIVNRLGWQEKTALLDKIIAMKPLLAEAKSFL